MFHILSVSFSQVDLNKFELFLYHFFSPHPNRKKTAYSLLANFRWKYFERFQFRALWGPRIWKVKGRWIILKINLSAGKSDRPLCYRMCLGTHVHLCSAQPAELTKVQEWFYLHYYGCVSLKSLSAIRHFQSIFAQSAVSVSKNLLAL